MAEKYAGSSPFVYALNNSLRGVDPDGRTVLDALRGYGVGLMQGTVQAVTSLFRVDQAVAGAVALASNPAGTIERFSGAVQQTMNTIMAPSSQPNDYERGRAIGNIAGNVVGGLMTAEAAAVARSGEMLGEASKAGSVATKGSAITSAEKIKDAAASVEKFVGEDAKGMLNKSGDFTVMSSDGMKQVDFHFNKTYPHKNPHAHAGEWDIVKNKKVATVQSGPIYPSNVPKE